MVKWSVVLFEDNDQILTTMSVLCYPYGSGISCMCDNRGRIYRCVAQVDTIHNVGQDPDPVLDQTLVHDSPSDPSQTLDERTEVILAATFLVLVVLTFVAWVISSLYGNCEFDWVVVGGWNLNEWFIYCDNLVLSSRQTVHMTETAPDIFK